MNTTSASITLLIMLCFSGLSAQIIHTASFTKSLNEAGIEYAEPAEQWLHVVFPPEDQFMHYDLVLQNDRNDFEVRYRIHHDTYNHQAVPPAIEVSRLVASIASNDHANDIYVSIPPADFLKSAFNADNGMIVRFIPKSQFSEKPLGALWTLYSENRPAIDIVILYNDPSFNPLTMYRSVKFRDLTE